MEIENHRLVTTPNDGLELEYRPGRPSVLPWNPQIALIHYGVTDSLDALWRAQHYSGFHAHTSYDGWSEHGEDGPVRGVSRAYHQIDFNRRASHAGKSTWNGHVGCNQLALGLEISNPGPLIEGKDGELRTVYGKVWPRSDAIKAVHKCGRAPGSWTHWARYSDEELDFCVQLVALWRKHYGIVDVLGHDDVAPFRKFDPGPAFPLQYVRRVVFGHAG